MLSLYHRQTSRFILAPLVVRLLLLVLLVGLPGADALRAQKEAPDSIPLSPEEWQQLEARLETNPYHFHMMERERAFTIIRAGMKTRPAGRPWYAMNGSMLCMIDGERRRQLEGQERVTAYRESIACSQEFYDFALERSQAMPTDSDMKVPVQGMKKGLAEAAVEAEETELAKSLALSLLEQNLDPNSFYYGAIIHDANQVLGRVALREGNVADARRHLLEAGKTPGGPGLNSFGPSFFLARELLDRGEREVVLEYLELVRRFWNNPGAVRILDQSEREIQEGEIPTSRNWH